MLAFSWPRFQKHAQDGLGLTQMAVGAEPLGRLLRAWAEHRDVQYRGDLSEVRVLGVHADGVQYTSSQRSGGQRSVIAGSFTIISAQRQEVRQKRHPIFVIRKKRLCNCGCHGYHTIQRIFEVIAWSLRCCLEGRAPTTRHDGSPFLDGEEDMRLWPGRRLAPAAVLQVRGDWEWIVTAFRSGAQESTPRWSQKLPLALRGRRVAFSCRRPRRAAAGSLSAAGGAQPCKRRKVVLQTILGLIL